MATLHTLETHSKRRGWHMCSILMNLRASMSILLLSSMQTPSMKQECGMGAPQFGAHLLLRLLPRDLLLHVPE